MGLLTEGPDLWLSCSNEVSVFLPMFYSRCVREGDGNPASWASLCCDVGLDYAWSWWVNGKECGLLHDGGRAAPVICQSEHGDGV
jgi:hypothetical protein